MLRLVGRRGRRLTCSRRPPAQHDRRATLVAILTLNGPRNRFGRAQIPEALHQMQSIVDRLTDLFWRDSTAE
jgi:hypothetical protein